MSKMLSPFWLRLALSAGIGATLWLVIGCGSGDYHGYKDGAYTVGGVRYHPLSPREALGYTETGISSHYREGFFIFAGRDALDGKLYPWSKGGAHKTLPLPCVVRITNLENGRKTKLRISDRGPFIAGRMLDVTEPVAKKLGFYEQGLARVRIEVLSVGDGEDRLR